MHSWFFQPWVEKYHGVPCWACHFSMHLYRTVTDCLSLGEHCTIRLHLISIPTPALWLRAKPDSQECVVLRSSFPHPRQQETSSKEEADETRHRNDEAQPMRQRCELHQSKCGGPNAGNLNRRHNDVLQRNSHPFPLSR